MVICFSVIVQFNSNISMKILHHMSYKFDNRFLMLVDTQKLVGGGYLILPFLVHFSLKTDKKVFQITFG